MSVDVLNESGQDSDLSELSALCRFVIEQMRLHPLTEMTVRLVDIDTIAELNEQWMGKAGPTDVLSFPMDELLPGRPGEDLPAPGYLGDIALCPQIAATQAPAAGHSTDAEMWLLTVHGMLHLMGYDHGTHREHAEMFGLQNRLLVDYESQRPQR